MNFLKTGIHFADAVNTVSPTYAREIKASMKRPGWRPLISKKGERFRGILNGVDYDTWSPEQDTLIPARYSAQRHVRKNQMQDRICRDNFIWKRIARIALIGFIGRLTGQKGVHLLKEVIERVVN